MRRIAAVLALASLALAVAVVARPQRAALQGCAGAAPSGAPCPAPTPGGQGLAVPRIAWRHSRVVGVWWNGRLVNGVRLPAWGQDFVTWDPVLKRSPDRSWRRWGTDRLIRTLLRVLAEYRGANPGAPRVAVGDISRPHGGPFGRRYGGLGHTSHQIGLDVDVYYPRVDGREEAPREPAQVDLVRAQDLVDRFVRAGAVRVFVGPHLPQLHGPPRVVRPLIYHDDHLHVRLPLR